MDARISHDVTMTDVAMSDNSNDTLSYLGNDVKQMHLYRCSPLSVLGLLARTSKQYEAETILFRLSQAAIHAAPEFRYVNQNAQPLAAIALLKSHLKTHSELLFTKMRVTDSYGREILASPYQIFLGAGDIWALKQVYNDILPLIPNGETQAAAQFKEQFPNYDKNLDAGMDEEARFYDARNKQQIAEIVPQLAIIKHLIDADPFNNNQPLDTTQQAIEKLCQLFQPKSGEVIRSGLHFPLAILQEIYKIYNALEGRCSFFTLAVIKPALDALSTVDGQCFRDGLSELEMVEKGPNRRCHSSYQHPLGQPLSLTLVNDKGRGSAAVVDPFDGMVLFASSTHPGHFDCYSKNASRVYAGGQLALLRALGPRRLCGKRGYALENLCRTKAVVLSKLLCSRAERSQDTIAMRII